MSDKYMLYGKTPRPVYDLVSWARAFETMDRQVASTDVTEGVRVSTVFLGMDHAFGGGPPLLFETMIFGGPHAHDQWRYSTWEEAEKGHAEAVKLAQSGTDSSDG